MNILKNLREKRQEKVSLIQKIFSKISHSYSSASSALRDRRDEAYLEETTKRTFTHVPYKKRKDFLVLLAKDFARYGAPLHRLEFLLDAIGESFRLECTFLVLPGVLFLSLKDGEKETESLVIKTPFGINMGKLSRITDVTHELLHCHITVDEAKKDLDFIRKNYNQPFWAPLIVFPFTSFIFCMIGFGGSWIDGLVSLFLGLVVCIVQIISNRSTQTFAYLFEFSAALLSSFTANILSRYLYPMCIGIQVAVFSSLAIILPGLAVTLAIIEISSKNFVSGIVRLFAALFSALLLGYGYSVGASLYPSPYSSCIPMDPMDWKLYIPFIPLGALFIAMALEARPHQLPIMVVVSCIGFASTLLLSPHLTPSAVATISSIFIGLASNIYARISRSPAIAPILCGILMLTPGSFGLKASLNFLGAQDVTGQNFVTAMFTIAMSITIGLFVAIMLSYPFQIMFPLPKHTFFFII